MTKYIRGRRQVAAIYIAVWSLCTFNWASFKREVHIITGFARPYKIIFCDEFWDDLGDMWTNGEVEIFRHECDKEDSDD